MGEYSYPKSYLPNAAYSPEEFFGRTSEMARVVALLEAGQNVCLTGLRHMGRTWFLNRLADSASHATTGSPVLLITPKIDMTELRGLLATEAAEKVLARVQQRLRDAGWIGKATARFGKNDWDGFADAFEFFDPLLKPNGAVMVLLLDEAEALADISITDSTSSAKPGSLAAKFRNVLDQGRSVRLLVATHLPLTTAWKGPSASLITSFTTVPFPGLDEDASTDLLKSREQINNVRFTPEALHRAYTLSRGHPFYLRWLGEKAVVLRATDGTIGESKIDSAFSQVRNECHAFLTMDYEQDTDEIHRRIMSELAIDSARNRQGLQARMPATVSPNGFAQHYRDLFEMGLFVPDQKEGDVKPQFANEFLRAFVAGLA